jgi:gas vesicle protein
MKQTYQTTDHSLSGKQVFLGVLLAAAYGFTAAVLLTPMSGKATRKRLKHFTD